MMVRWMENELMSCGKGGGPQVMDAANTAATVEAATQVEVT